MKKFINIMSLVVLVAACGVQAGQSSKRAYKPAAKQTGRRTAAAKPMAQKNDKELLQAQIAQRSSDPKLMDKVNRDKELKKYIDTHVCPIRNWQEADRLATANWIRGAYDATITGAKKKYKDMYNIETLLVSLVYSAFTHSPYYMNLKPNVKKDMELGQYVNYLVLDNMERPGESKLFTPKSYERWED